jgi:hypothetical protein
VIPGAFLVSGPGRLIELVSGEELLVIVALMLPGDLITIERAPRQMDEEQVL